MFNKININLLIVTSFYIFGVISSVEAVYYFNFNNLSKIKIILILLFLSAAVWLIKMQCKNAEFFRKYLSIATAGCVFIFGNYQGIHLAAENLNALNKFIKNGDILELTGIVKNIKNEQNGIYFIMKIESLKNFKNEVFNITDDIPVSISYEKGLNGSVFKNGDKIKITAAAEKIHEYRNPYLYSNLNPLIKNFKFRLKSKDGNLKVISRKKNSGVNEYFAEKIKNGLTTHFKQEIAGFLKAFFLGDSSELDKNILMGFQKTGLIHVLIVSGSHLTLMISLISSILQKFNLNLKINFAVTVFIVTFYVAIIGIQAAVTRAYIAFLLTQTAILAKREKYEFQILNSTFFIQILIWPAFLFNFGFWLSYIATFMLLISKKINIFSNISAANFSNSNIINSLLENINACIITILGTYPVISYFTGFFPACSIFSNIFTLWIYELILILTMFFTACYIIFSPLCFLISPALFFLSFTALKINSGLTFFMQYNISPYNFSIIEVISLYIAILIFYGLFFDNLKLFFNTFFNFKYFLTAAAAIVIIIAFKSLILLNIRGFEIYFMDVGQGDCTLVRTERGKYIMIDAGGSNETVYEKILVPLFQKIRVSKIEYLIITHGHFDHYCSALKLLESGIPIKNWIYSDSYSAETEYKRLLLRLEKSIQNQVYVKAGDEINVDGINLKILWPDVSNHKIQFTQNENDCSIAFLMQYKNLNAFFSGDISQAVEKELLNQLPETGVKILKAAHHGSRTSSSEEFIRRLQPELSFIPAAESNKFGHPHKESLEILKKYSKNLFISRESGGIKINRTGKKFDVINYKLQKILSIY